MKDELLEIPLSKIVVTIKIRPVNQAHIRFLGDFASLDEIVVSPHEDGTYELIDGLNRLSVAQAQRKELVRVRVRHYPEDEQGALDRDLDRYRLNLHHGRPLTSKQRDRGIRRLWATYDKHGLTQRQLAKTFGLTDGRISQILHGEDDEEPESTPDAGDKRTAKRPFSDYARFSSALNRMKTQLEPDNLTPLLQERGTDVRRELSVLHERLLRVLQALAKQETEYVS